MTELNTEEQAAVQLLTSRGHIVALGGSATAQLVDVSGEYYRLQQDVIGELTGEAKPYSTPTTLKNKLQLMGKLVLSLASIAGKDVAEAEDGVAAPVDCMVLRTGGIETVTAVAEELEGRIRALNTRHIELSLPPNTSLGIDVHLLNLSGSRLVGHNMLRAHFAAYSKTKDGLTADTDGAEVFSWVDACQKMGEDDVPISRHLLNKYPHAYEYADTLREVATRTLLAG